jgi:epoxyqueuosine reductase
MAWMADSRRAEVRQYWPPTRSIICVALNYYHPATRSTAANHAKIARYAWGRDYHRVLESRLKQLDRDIRIHLAQEERAEDDPSPDGPPITSATYQSRLAVDSRPVMDKALAQQAGIGWIGKHANLISRHYGSWLFLGALLTNLSLVGDRPHTAHCGTCTRCLEACPTQAIVAPFTVDANRCIAYHTIENRAADLPPAIAPHLQGWVAGCDICQDVCPWNQRFAQPTDVDDFAPRPGRLDTTHEAIATWHETDWDQFTRSSALRRIKPAMFRRNAIANTPTQSP